MITGTIIIISSTSHEVERGLTLPTSLVRVERTFRDPRVRRATVFSGLARVFEVHSMFTASCNILGF